MGWLDARTVRIIGQSPAIADALVAQGASIVVEGSSDCLVHISPAPPMELAHEISYQRWRETLDAGLDRCFLAAREFAANCRAEGKTGAIVFVGAPEQKFGSDHAAAAGALGNLTKTLGVEWARDGIRVNCIQTTADEATLGNLTAYFLSDYAAYVTGAVTGICFDD